MSVWDGLDRELREAPLFPVQAPDGQKHLSELQRVVQFRTMVRMLAPKVTLYANANAGRRSRQHASAEGIMAGVSDYTALWKPFEPFKDRGCAWIEFKGYDKRGQAGKLSQAQIDFGNGLVRLGHRVACFFDPGAAVEWLRECGAPIRGVIT